MKLNNIVYSFSEFASAMAKLHDEKHFDYLVTIIGEDFGEEGLGCIYILENTDTHERISVKTIAEKKGDSDVIWSITSLYKCANLLEREVYSSFVTTSRDILSVRTLLPRRVIHLRTMKSLTIPCSIVSTRTETS